MSGVFISYGRKRLCLASWEVNQKILVTSHIISGLKMTMLRSYKYIDALIIKKQTNKLNIVKR